MAVGRDLRHGLVACELHERVSVRQAQVVVAGGELRLRDCPLEGVVYFRDAAQAHAAIGVAVCVETSVIVRAVCAVDLGVEVICHCPVREYVEEAHAVLLQVAFDAVYAVERFAR